MARSQQSKAIENGKKKEKYLIWMKKKKKKKASNAILTPYA